ncbi:MAG: sulfite exporter TauE/SafE family protein [Pseudomonadales bacterium]|nr:sulfite exporter TauE/SafE family protein [Pseudomonadales bacterium]
MDAFFTADLMQYILAGAGVGLLVGLTGVGGGSLMTPLLILFGIDYKVAIGTDLLYAAITKMGGVHAHSKQGTVRWRIVLWLGAGSIPASLVTAYFLSHIEKSGYDYSGVLTSALGFMLIITALVIFFRKRLQKQSHDSSRTQEKSRVQKHLKAITIFTGLLLGICVTLSSVGAGAFGAAVLMLLYPRLSAINIVGTDLAHAVPLTLIAGMGHLLLLGNVDFGLLVALLIGSIPAVQLGTKIGARMPNHILQPILATILLGLGFKFLLF